MMIGSGSSGIGIQGFFSRLTDTAIIFEGKTVSVDPLTNNVANSGSGKYRVTATPLNGRVTIRQIDHMLSGNESPRLGRKFRYFNTDFNYIPMSRFDREKGPAMGVCTWAYYQQRITEKDVLEIGEWMTENFLPFGAKVLQIDDGWQYHSLDGIKSKGDFRISHPVKFPSGIKYLGQKISDMGLDLGIWMLANYNSAPDLLKDHKDWYMAHPDGGLAYGNWPGYLFDVTSPSLWENYYIPLFEEARNEWKVKYFKFDGLKWPGRHLYHSTSSPEPDKKNFIGAFYDTRYERENVQHMDQAYNDWMVKLRALMGPDTYVLACQGPAYWATGSVSASRFTGDIFGTDGQLGSLANNFSRFLPLHSNSFWLDPDHLMLGEISERTLSTGYFNDFDRKTSIHSTEKSRLWATMVALTGSVVMSGDNVSALPSERIELYQQILPIVSVHPIEFGDIGEKPPVWALNIKRDFDEWTVVSLFNFDSTQNGKEKEVSVSLDELGLDKREYIVWNYFREKVVSLENNRVSYTINPMSNELLAVHNVLGHPQVLSTTRHLTQGGVELEDVQWDEENLELTVKALAVENHSYDIIVYVPKGYSFVSSSCNVEKQNNNIIRLQVGNSKEKDLEITVKFEASSVM